MQIKEIAENKKQYLELLLLADEQESMIDLYLDAGTLYVLEQSGQTIGVCVILPIHDGRDLEIKNIATHPAYQGRGYGRKLIEFVKSQNAGKYDYLYVGTGDSPLTVPFYEKCGFTHSHRIKNFFTDNYDHPIIEEGVLLIDMVYLKMPLR